MSRICGRTFRVIRKLLINRKVPVVKFGFILSTLDPEFKASEKEKMTFDEVVKTIDFRPLMERVDGQVNF